MTSAPPEPDTDSSNKPKVKHIANPRRLLILTPTSQSLSTIPPFLHSLTGIPVHDPPRREAKNETEPPVPPQSVDTPSAPSTTTTSFAGYTTHSPLRLQTKYYAAEIPVWVDEIPLPGEVVSQGTEDNDNDNDTDKTTPGATQWRAEFLSAEAEIVREAVGALVVCVHSPEPSSSANPASNTGHELDPAERADVRAVRDLMRDVGAVKGCIDEERGGVGDVPGVLVLIGAQKSAATRAPVSGGQDGDELELGGGEDGLDDEPLSVTWWEDQLFDMGLYGWEVVQWDPLEQGGEKTRNKFGGMFAAPAPLANDYFLFFFFFGVANVWYRI